MQIGENVPRLVPFFSPYKRVFALDTWSISLCWLVRLLRKQMHRERTLLLQLIFIIDVTTSTKRKRRAFLPGPNNQSAGALQCAQGQSYIAYATFQFESCFASTMRVFSWSFSLPNFFALPNFIAWFNMMHTRQASIFVVHILFWGTILQKTLVFHSYNGI